MNYLLDTCVISELVKDDPDERVLAWFESIDCEELFLSVITIGEIQRGISSLPETKRKRSLARWLGALINEYRSRIYGVDIPTAELWGTFQGEAGRRGKTVPAIDCLIAATASSHNLVVVTRNEKDFIATQVPVLNPWQKNG